jgi:hypothetical protein
MGSSQSGDNEPINGLKRPRLHAASDSEVLGTKAWTISALRLFQAGRSVSGIQLKEVQSDLIEEKVKLSVQ